MQTLQSFGFPPFTRAVKQIMYVCIAIYLTMFVMQRVNPDLNRVIVARLGLVPEAVFSLPVPHVWQVVTYSFIHDYVGVGHILFNMLSLWLFGATLEQTWGYRKFLEFYFFCVVGSALITIAVSYANVLGLSPERATIGASGGLYGLLVAFGIIFAEMRIFVMGIFPIKAKWFAIIWILIAILMGEVAHLGGVIFGFAYIRFMPRQGMPFVFSERYYGLRNWYHRYKRKQAQKKFEVYMGKVDRNQYFDEHGNFRDPDERKGNGDGGGKWVN